MNVQFIPIHNAVLYKVLNSCGCGLVLLVVYIYLPDSSACCVGIVIYLFPPLQILLQQITFFNLFM